ncbi:hypothetical protein TELCIR_09851 [Teladorsagia circumcincta]|uniref:MSP domain-containing protein n=1 Tax=Teladorsagia circumcincta TaxID=45464 RepID=A0A2G9UDP4_TELCI|nr:hypothetical protein TELCIR_09851 [Teladorsagia circumcincta]
MKEENRLTLESHKEELPEKEDFKFLYSEMTGEHSRNSYPSESRPERHGTPGDPVEQKLSNREDRIEIRHQHLIAVSYVREMAPVEDRGHRVQETVLEEVDQPSVAKMRFMLSLERISSSTRLRRQAHLNIKNINASGRHTGWAFKTTNMRSVDPVCGVLDPNEAILMAVACDIFNYGREDTNNGRIFVEWVTLLTDLPSNFVVNGSKEMVWPQKKTSPSSTIPEDMHIIVRLCDPACCTTLCSKNT